MDPEQLKELTPYTIDNFYAIQRHHQDMQARRCTGRTTIMIDAVLNSNALFVVANYRTKDDLIHQEPRLKHRVLVADDAGATDLRMYRNPVFYDHAIIERWIGYGLKAMEEREALKSIVQQQAETVRQLQSQVEHLNRKVSLLSGLPIGWALIHKHDHENYQDKWWVQNLVTKNDDEIQEFVMPDPPRPLRTEVERHVGATPFKALEQLG